MNFTREPIIETVIVAKEGHKLVVRSSKGGTQEEFFVDAVEVISFGNSCFFRSLEKPKSFLVPVNDYEILEVREARMVLKSSGVERGIKIGGGKEAALKASREKEILEEVIEEAAPSTEEEAPAEQKIDKRRERRRFRKRRGKPEFEGEEQESTETRTAPEGRPSLIPPPPTLISETLGRRKEIPEVEKEEEADAQLSDEENRAAEDEHIPF